MKARNLEEDAARNLNHLKQVVVDAEGRQVVQKVPDDSMILDQECQTRDSNISQSFIGNDLNYNNYCLECKYILYY